MKITIIYGQNHKGSTYNIARMLADKVIANWEKFNNGIFPATRLRQILPWLHELLYQRRKTLPPRRNLTADYQRNG